MSNLTIEQVREKLAEGKELFRYKSTRNTFPGWVIDNQCVHGGTVNALFRRGEIAIVTPPAKDQSFIVRRAYKV